VFYIVLCAQYQVIQPVNGDPFVGMLETPVTSAPIVARLAWAASSIMPTLRQWEFQGVSPHNLADKPTTDFCPGFSYSQLPEQPARIPHWRCPRAAVSADC
jgi:hypothetical protein